MRSTLFIIIVLCYTSLLTAQSIGISESIFSPDPSAILDVNSSDKGFLMPRLSSNQKNSIVDPAEGLMVYDTVTSSFWYFENEHWTEIGKSEGFSLDTCGGFEENIGIFPNILFEDCGTLYDTGGEFAPYSDSESEVISIIGDSEKSIRRIIVHSTILAEGDTLRIESGLFKKEYSGIFFDLDTLYLPAKEMILIYFNSDVGPSTGDGFKISWDTYNAVESNTNQRSGFYCNNEKSSFGGGIQLNDEWGDGSGIQNVNFGVFSKTNGESSISIGTYADSGPLSIALGKNSVAEDQATAVGYNAIADNFGSIALGQAISSGNYSIGVGVNANARLDNSIAMGYNARSESTEGISIGKNSLVNGTQGIVVGNSSTTNGQNAIILGNNVISNCDDCIILGQEGFGSSKVGINKADPAVDLDVGGNVKAEKIDVQDDFGEIAITSNNPTLQPTLSLFKNPTFDLVGKITSNLQNNLVFSAQDGILNEANTFVSGTLSTSSLIGSGNRDVYVSSQGELIVKPVETHFYMIPPYEFVSDDEDSYPLYYENFVSSISNGVLDETDELKIFAPVEIPSGAEVNSVSFSYFNDLDELQIDFALKRRTILGQSVETICHVVGGPTTATTLPCTDINGNYNVIDNENYYYFIQIGDSGEELPTDLTGGFYSVRVDYMK